MDQEPASAINLFYCHAHEDIALCEELDKHLVTLQHSKLIVCWSKQMISSGRERKQEIKHQLSTAQIILLLVSPDFIASYDCYEEEMEFALKRHEADDARVIPIILRHTYWKMAPFSKLQVLPAGANPIVCWSDRDQFFVSVVAGIHKVVDEIIAKQGLNRSGRLTLESATETRLSSGSAPSAGKYNIRANEINVAVLGDNNGTVNYFS